jgi:transketolase
MGLEDVSLMRALPKMAVFQPMDAESTRRIMDALVETWVGPAYLRLTRQNLPGILESKHTFQLTKLTALESSDSGFQSPKKIILIGTGAGTAEVLCAAQSLNQKGLSFEVWDAHCLKPFDQTALLEMTRRTGTIVTVEDHSVIGGLGSAVAEVLAEAGAATRLVRVGVQDEFGESGEPTELLEKHGITSQAILKRIESLF